MSGFLGGPPSAMNAARLLELPGREELQRPCAADDHATHALRCERAEVDTTRLPIE